MAATARAPATAAAAGCSTEPVFSEAAEVSPVFGSAPAAFGLRGGGRDPAPRAAPAAPRPAAAQARVRPLLLVRRLADVDAPRGGVAPLGERRVVVGQRLRRGAPRGAGDERRRGRPRPRRRVPRDDARRRRRVAAGAAVGRGRRRARARGATGAAGSGDGGAGRTAARRPPTKDGAVRGGARRRSASRGGPSAKPAGRPPNMAALRLRRAFWSRSLQKRNGSAASTPKWWSSSAAARAARRLLEARRRDVRTHGRGFGRRRGRRRDRRGGRRRRRPRRRRELPRHGLAEPLDERRHVALAALDVGRALLRLGELARRQAAVGVSAAAARKFVRCVRRLRNKASSRRASRAVLGGETSGVGGSATGFGGGVAGQGLAGDARRRPRRPSRPASPWPAPPVLADLN